MPVHPPHPAAGFTLVELMIVVAIAGILSAIAYPAFMSQLRQSRRADAVQAITGVQQAQERWRAGNTTYTNALASLNVPVLQLVTGTTTYRSSNGYYTITITSNTGTGYTVTATAVSGTSQAGDTGCTTIAVVMSNGAATLSQPSCWRQ